MTSRRRLKRLCGALLVAGVALLAGRRRWRRRTRRYVDDFYRGAGDNRQRRFDEAELGGLPAPVREYFENVLRDGQPYADAVRLEQEGTLRTGGESSPWLRFTATQYVTTDPPGFLWDARVGLGPFAPIRVRDGYRRGDGAATVSLLGLLTLDGADATPELNEAALMRYMAEAVWYPTALLPGGGVEWEAVDDHTARATLAFRGTSATLTYTFDDGEVRRVHADARYRSVDGGFEPTPWSGYWDDYERRGGVRVPTTGEVVWHLPGGDLHAWRGRLTRIDHDG